MLMSSYIFDASLNQHILHKFLDLKDDAKIISLRSFDKTDRKITARTSQSIGSILKGKEVGCLSIDPLVLFWSG